MSRYVENEAGFAELNAPGGLIDRAVARASGHLRDTAKRNAPVDTGRLRQSIESSRHSFSLLSVVYRVGTRVFYGPYQEGGTGIYGPRHSPIVPRRAKALRFIPKGNRGTAVPFSPFVYAKSVKGSPATHFLTKALAATGLRDFSVK